MNYFQNVTQVIPDTQVFYFQMATKVNPVEEWTIFHNVVKVIPEWQSGLFSRGKSCRDRQRGLFSKVEMQSCI